MFHKDHRTPLDKLPYFDRRFLESKECLTYVGSGSIGGKAQGLAFIKDILAASVQPGDFPGISIQIPRLVVVATTIFDLFMERNNLSEIAYSDASDDRIAHAFQHADLPAEIVGDLRALITSLRTPLAVRSSSLLEDAMYEPFAGVYETKMIPNNQPDNDTRYRKLTEAIKFVYASTFFKDAKNYIKVTKNRVQDEKMAVIIQEVVGHRHGDRYYPHLSGVARSFNFYPTGHSKPEDGVVNLALGLGKTIVGGGKSWTYSPAYPHATPPYNSISDLLKQTQTDFWVVNMGKPPAYDPTKETEYLALAQLKDADYDGILRFLASTYNAQRDRIVMGTMQPGPRILTFAPILGLRDIPLNDVLKKLLKICEQSMECEVEIEFAMTLDTQKGLPARFGFLQVRPMVVSHVIVDIDSAELKASNVIAASTKIMGNGVRSDVQDVVYVKPETFMAKDTRQIAAELDSINKELVNQNIPYLLIGFGRWGSSDPWLGIPVNWSQISGAKVIVEATLKDMNVDISQGSHFFHNISSFQISYFSVQHTGDYKIDWEWLNSQSVVTETAFVKHVRLANPLIVKVDGRNSRGVITHA